MNQKAIAFRFLVAAILMVSFAAMPSSVQAAATSNPAEPTHDDQSACIRRLCQTQPGVSLVEKLDIRPATGDWLIAQSDQHVQLLVEPARDGRSARLALCNGLASRTFVVSENLACVSIRTLANTGLSSEAEFLRAVKPEARVMLDGTWYEIGGLKGQPEMAFLMADWIKTLKADPHAFRFTGITACSPEPRYPWKPSANAVAAAWPPKGLHVIMNYDPPAVVAEKHKGVKIQLHYEMYAGAPIMAKWMTLTNGSVGTIVVDRIETEILAVAQDTIKRLDVESDYSFALVNAVKDGSVRVHFPGGGATFFGGSTTEWSADPDYHNWATQNAAEDIFLAFPHICLLKSRIPLGPAECIAPGGAFKSHVTFELLHDSFDRERQGLGRRRMYRTLCPQVTEHLLTICATSTDPALLRKLIDQAAETAFEAINIGPWIGFQIDTESPAEIAKWKNLVDYAHSKGIKYVGGYELMVSSRDHGPQFNTIDPTTGKPGSVFGQSTCWASGWVDPYYKRLWNFLDKTGMSHVGVDGCYHGDPCASTKHPYHRGLEDSQWMQWKKMVEYFDTCMRRNTIAPAPDWYFFNGATSTGMGYREGTEFLPYEQQLLMARQFIYDGTWNKAPSMGWIATPVIDKNLSKVIPWYEGNLAQGLGSGAQWSLYGMQIYDTDETKAAVKKWVNWFKKHRSILTSDIIHVRRPDGRDVDCILHVNPQLHEKGLVMIFNPLNETLTRTVSLPLYYAGLSRTAWIREQDGEARSFPLSRDYRVEMTVTLPPRGAAWYVITETR
jgi:hypothetical protein